MKPEDGYISYIVNPKSGPSSRKTMGRRFHDYLVEKGFDVRATETKSLGHACDLATDAAVDYDCALVVAVGGDGTVREVAHGLEGSDKPMLMIASGTENLLASELGFDERVETVIKAFEGGYSRRIDLGMFNDRCFTSVSGFGFDADVVQLVNEHRKGNIRYFDYVGPIWHTFWRHKFPRMKVEADGREIFNDRGMIFIGNISRYGGGFGILNRADIADGLLDICAVQCNSRIRMLRRTVRIATRTHIGKKGIVYEQAKDIKVTSDDKVRTQIDGDPGPELPVEIKVVPSAVDCIVLRNAKPVGLRTRIKRWLR